MNKDKINYNSMPGDYDTEKLTDIHSKSTKPSSYARNIGNFSDAPRSKASYNSSDRSIEAENEKDTTERIPTLLKYSDINDSDDRFDYKGEI